MDHLLLFFPQSSHHMAPDPVTVVARSAMSERGLNKTSNVWMENQKGSLRETGNTSRTVGQVECRAVEPYVVCEPLGPGVHGLLGTRQHSRR